MNRIILTIATVLAFCVPAFAGDTKCPPGMTQPEVEQMLDRQGLAYAEIPAGDLAAFVAAMEKATGADYGSVTAAITAKMGDYTVFGLVVDGCMSNPIPFPESPQAPARYSGAQPDGRVGA